MALGDPYATPEQLVARLGKEDDGTFTRLLDAASRAVETFARRQFNKATVPSARRFRPLDLERLPVDDFWDDYDITVEVDGVLWDEDSYDALPSGGLVDGQDGWPFSELFAVKRCWPYSRRPLVTVTALWGWEAVPSGIIEATLDVAEVMSLGGRIGSGQSGVIRSESIGGYAISFGGPDLGANGHADVPRELVKALPYRRKRFGVA